MEVDAGATDTSAAASDAAAGNEELDRVQEVRRAQNCGVWCPQNAMTLGSLTASL